MNLISASRKVLEASWDLANLPLGVRGLFLTAKERSFLEKNKVLRGKFEGERCFVLGGGPSLKEVDLNWLKNERLITVNRLYLLDWFAKNPPLFHCALDPKMYCGETGKEFFDVMDAMPETKFLVSRKAPDSIKSRDNVYSICFGLLPSKHCAPYNLSKLSAAFINVSLFAIELAVYLGFKEIILLGCDFNQFAFRTEVHSYEQKENIRQCSLLQDLLGHAIALMQHERLRSECALQGANVCNATEGSMLEVYPRAHLKDILN